jgi:hypothetical protein
MVVEIIGQIHRLELSAKHFVTQLGLGLNGLIIAFLPTALYRTPFRCGSFLLSGPKAMFA